ncbi:helix-turn-helix transcriptional regulator [Butyrivibrio fibrisolvens]|uniref:helix-turn-helix domain-containing protein n=1 Tax=Pseudobutyrivibrio ruminis TaxID=46206 RepID=UPI00040D11FF|nr:helix-turn-helix transcriptional regulator [Pseudobutyrivibrio ruminis]MDC7280772.1 helix-turn-helix transcriptional regulator [Butyrivibrio fibrisolvens]
MENRNLQEISEDEYDAKQEIKRLTSLVIGNRTLSQVAEKTEIHKSYLSRLKRGEHIPGIDIMKKLTAPESDPQNGISLEDFMIAARIISPNEGKYISDLAVRKQKIQIETREFVSKAWKIIDDTFFNKGIATREVNEREWDSEERGFKPDFVFKLNNVDRWYFKHLYIKSLEEDYFSRFMCILGLIACMSPDSKHKVSIIINNPDAFIALDGVMQQGLALKANVSLILMDLKKNEVTYETIGSSYSDNGEVIKMPTLV